MAENKAFAQQKPRPIIRVGLFLISHSVLVSLVCCIAGILAIFLLPILAKSTYISENALMPGSAGPMLSNDDASEGLKFLNKILSLSSKTGNTGIEIPELIADEIIDLGGEANHHKFPPQINKFHPVQFFLGPDTGITKANRTCSSYGLNTVGIIRSLHGDGKEAIVLVTPYSPVNITSGEALSLGVAYSVFSLLSRVTWLAKDIIWLAADSRHGEYSAVAAWLRDYNTLSFGDFNLYSEMSDGCALPGQKTSRSSGEVISEGFHRAGTMAAALVIKVTDSSTDFENDILKIYVEASNGQMPNLDLINIVNYLAVHGQGLHVRVEKIWSLLDSWWLNSLGKFFSLVGKVAKSLNPQWNFGIPVVDYVEGTATLASSLYNQALGVPTGPHGAFRDYQVDAITMEISPKFSSRNKVMFLLRVGRLVEGVLRSVNNLLEKFHQSFFLYLLTSPSRFVSVGVYMIAFGLLIAPLPLVAASLFSNVSILTSGNYEITSDQAGGCTLTFTSWKWLRAAKIVLVVHMWSVIVALLPYFLCQIPNASPSMCLLIWIFLSIFGLFFLGAISDSLSILSTSHSQRTKWTLLKSATIAAAFIGLCLMSVINFATAEIGALLLVPMCLTIVPLRLDVKGSMMLPLVRGTYSLLLLFMTFPPTLFFVLKGSLEGLENVKLGDFWNWTQSLWAWSSATYIYLCIVHLPCWVLCAWILLHRS